MMFYYLNLSLILIECILLLFIIYKSKHRAAAFEVLSVLYPTLELALPLDLANFNFFEINGVSTSRNQHFSFLFKNWRVHLTDEILCLDLS